MKTTRTLLGLLVLPLLATLAVGPGVAAGAIIVTGRRPACPAARYVEKATKGATPIVADVDGASLRLSACKPVVAVRRTIAKGTTLRATLDCAAARTRVRLLLASDCSSIAGELVAKGSPIRRFTGLLSNHDDSEDDDGGGLPDGAIAIEAADNAPQITGFSPTHAEVGEAITIQGQNFNRDRAGLPWSGTPPYRLYFKRQSPPTMVQAEFTFVSATQLLATVPARTGTGLVSLAEPVQFGVGSNYGWSPTDFVVDQPPGSPTVLRVRNNTQYNLVDLQLNGEQAITAQQDIPPGAALDIPFTTPGSVQVVAGVGFFDGFGSPDVWFFLGGQATVSTGLTTTMNLNALAITNLLTNFGASADWLGEYYDDNFAPHAALLRFFANGTWTLFSDGTQVQTGILTQLSWPSFASEVSFRISQGVPATSIAYPFGSFLLDNGPASWRTIQYVLQN